MATTKKAKPAKKSAPAKKGKPTKKTVPSKKTAKKATKELTEKPTKKVPKKVIKKAVKKVVKKTPKKVVPKKTKKEIVKTTDESTTPVQYSIKFHVYGYGKENCVQELNDVQKKYWKKKFDEDEYEACDELKDHVWDFDYTEDPADTHFGKWYDQDSILHDEKASYSQSSILNVTVLRNGEEVETIEIPVTDKKLKKSFSDEFVPNKKKNKGKAYLYTGSTDRGIYCDGSFDLEEGDVFDKSKLSINVGKIFNDEFVWDVCYDQECLMDEGCSDSIGKGFDCELFFF